MPTKFNRVRCSLCSALKVAYKCPRHYSAKSDKFIYLCWDCSKQVRDKLLTFNLDEKPVKKELLARAVRIPKKTKSDPYNKF